MARLISSWGRRLRAGLACGAAMLVAAALSITPAGAQTSPATLTAGTVVENILALDGGKSIPLPEGRWIVAGNAAQRLNEPSLGAFGRMRNIILFRLEGRRVTAMAEVNENILPTTDGWGIAADCARRDLTVAVVRYKAGWDGSCFFVAHTITQGSASQNDAPTAWRDAVAYARGEDLDLPGLWLTAGFRVTNRTDVLDVRMHFSPEANGLPREVAPRRWRDSPWHAERLPQEAQRLAFAQALAEWSITFSGLVEAGLKGRIDPATRVAMPGAPASEAPGTDALAARVATLNGLLRDGVISPETHAEQLRRLTEGGLNPTSEVADPATVAFYKTLSYRPIVSFINFWIDLYWIGTPFAAGVLEVLQIVVNSYKFYMHELAWNQLISAGTRPDAARTIDFAYVGRNA